MNEIHEDTDVVETLAGMDLNLLVAFDMLVREGSVTRAAKRMYVTQSAMSHSLRRLRELLDDPLLVRGRNGMVPTPRAEALSVPVRSSLLMLQRAVFQPPQFDPSQSVRSFRLASPDLFDVLILPTLLERIGREAPKVNISVVEAAGQQLVEGLETGEVDFAILPRMAGSDAGESNREPPPGLCRRTLFHDSLVCLLRGEHPAIGARSGRGKGRGAPSLSLEAYAGLSHAMVSTEGSGAGPVDDALADLGLKRRIALRLPNFFSALEIVAKSDLVLTGPEGLTRLIQDPSRIVAFKPPLELPGHDIQLVWHERFSNDPGHAWLGRLIGEVARIMFG